MVDFGSLLETKIEDTKPPMPVPAGAYFVTVNGIEETTSSRKGTPGIRVFFSIDGGFDDATKKKIKDGGEEVAKTLSKEKHDDFWVTEDSLIMLRQWLEDALKVKIAGRQYKEALAEVKGKQAVVVYKHEISTESGRTRAVVDRWLPKS